MTRSPRYTGVIPPLVTPLTSDGAVDEGALRALVDFQLEAGVDGLFVLGSSGEAAYLGDDARRSVVSVAREHVAGRVPLFVGAVETTTHRVAQQVRWIDGFDVAAIVVSAPFYANVSAAEARTHFEVLAKTTATPLIAYDIPGNVGRKLPREVVTGLLDDGTIAGLKDSSGSLVDFRQIIEAAPSTGTASLLTGADTTADLALQLGADGLVAGLANVRPDLFVTMYRAFQAGDAGAVRDAQLAVIRLSELYSLGERYGIGRHASELGAMKHALTRSGIIGGAIVSVPMSRYPEAALPELFEILDRVDAPAREAAL